MSCDLQYVIFLVCIVTTITSIDSGKFKQHVNFKLKESFVTGRYNHPSVTGCVAICGGSQNCVSVSWNPDTLQCIVSDKSIEHQYDLGLNADTISTWISYAKMTYDVWHIIGPGRYTMTYLEAEAECAKERGRVARTTEVLAARAEGFSFCACSWMVDENNDPVNGFVLQVASLPCWQSFNTGIIGCGFVTADAFCADDL